MATLTSTYQLLVQSDEGYEFNPKNSGMAYMRIYAKCTQYISENYSIVTIKMERHLTSNYSGDWYSCASRSASLSGDVSHSFSDGYKKYMVGDHVIFEKDFKVKHNDDGSKSLSLSASYSDSHGASQSAWATCSLPTIPRKSEIKTVSFTDDAIERGFSISFTPASTSFTHRVEVIADGETVASRDGYSAGSVISFTADELLALYRKNVKTVTVRLITKTNGSNIGTDDESKTLSAVGNAHIKVGGEWKRGVIYVGSAPGVVMIKQNGEWRVAR